jgi:hypothetical protein
VITGGNLLNFIRPKKLTKIQKEINLTKKLPRRPLKNPSSLWLKKGFKKVQAF